MIGIENASGHPSTFASSIDTPVTPPSMKWLDRRKPLRPKPADKMPAMMKAASRIARPMPRPLPFSCG